MATNTTNAFSSTITITTTQESTTVTLTSLAIGIYGADSVQSITATISVPVTIGSVITSSTTGISSVAATNINSATVSSTESLTSSGANTTSQPITTTSATPGPTNAISPGGSGGNSGVSPGATAGIAIGCVVLGLAIGALAAYLFLRRRQKTRPQPEYVPMEYGMGREKGLSAAPPVESSGLALDQYLLDSKPDAEIAGEMRNLAALIQQHVENNYHLRPVQQSASTLAQVLMNLGIPQTGALNCSNLASLALDPRTRSLALRHVIAKVTFESATLFGNSPLSLLPAFVPAFSRAVPPVEQHRGSTEAFSAAMTRWRQLSAFLIHPRRSDRIPLMPSEDISTQQAEQLAIALNRFLKPFSDASDRESHYEQENHLREVIVECATYGYLLFSQPSDIRIRFDGGGSNNGLVVSPGLERVTDERGRRLPTPQTLVTPVVEDI
ncbi:hypothetical protein AB5N19_04458 [Seiridium cardinale]|uniref:Uncharacterized protein n=1 Tax=Seiridium cardinale TaxID=138064 RepID=A0ABR2XVV1_9PEZI